MSLSPLQESGNQCRVLRVSTEPQQAPGAAPFRWRGQGPLGACAGRDTEMPPSGGRRWQPRETEWREAARDRFEASRNRRPAVQPGRGRPEAFGEEVASMAQAIDRRERGGGHHEEEGGTAQATSSSVLLAQLQYHRSGEAGLMGGIVQPDRHTWMVEGRPVQVQCIHHCIWRSWEYARHCCAWHSVGKKDASEPFAVALCFFVSEPFALTYSTYISNKLDKKHGRGSIQFDGS